MYVAHVMHTCMGYSILHIEVGRVTYTSPSALKLKECTEHDAVPASCAAAAQLPLLAAGNIPGLLQAESTPPGLTLTVTPQLPFSVTSS